MSEPNTPTPPAPGKKALTAADAAKAVKRLVTAQDKDGKATIKEVAVKADEVLSFRDYGTHLVVVTTDGQKLSSAQA